MTRERATWAAFWLAALALGACSSWGSGSATVSAGGVTASATSRGAWVPNPAPSIFIGCDVPVRLELEAGAPDAIR